MPPVRKEPRKRYLLPSEYLGKATTHLLVAATLRRARPALMMVWGIPLAAYCWRSAHDGEWGGNLIVLTISAACGYLLWHALVTGYTESNHGEFLRAERPFGYWLTVLLLLLGYAMPAAGLFFVESTRAQHPAIDALPKSSTPPASVDFSEQGRLMSIESPQTAPGAVEP